MGSPSERLRILADLCSSKDAEQCATRAVKDGGLKAVVRRNLERCRGPEANRVVRRGVRRVGVISRGASPSSTIANGSS